MEAVEARCEAEKAKKEAEYIGNITNNTKLVNKENTKVIDELYDRITHVHEKPSESGSKYLKCYHCNSTFEMDSSLKVHIKRLHKIESVSQDQLI